MSDINLNDYEPFMVADYAPLGKPYVLTISGASVVKTFDRKTNSEADVPALHFRETKKMLRLTSSNNRRALGRLYGAASSGWIGKAIVVRVVEKKIGGEAKRYFVIDAVAPRVAPEFVVVDQTLAGPASDAQAVKSDIDKMINVLTFHEIPDPEMVVKRTIERAKGDHAAALAAIEKQYGSVPVL